MLTLRQTSRVGWLSGEGRRGMAAEGKRGGVEVQIRSRAILARKSFVMMWCTMSRIDEEC